MTVALGWQYTAPVPDVDDVIALGYTHVRFYYASSEDGSYALGASQALVSGTYSYTYNKTDGLAGDWAQWCFYGLVPGEGIRTDPLPVGPPTITTAKLIRQAVGRRTGLMDLFTITTASDADTCVISEAIDADALASKYARRFVRISGGTAIGQTRRLNSVVNAAVGYIPASGTFNINRATSAAWQAGDELELWVARGDKDMSALVDFAMQDARRHIWIGDYATLITVESQSEYVMPQGAMADHIGVPEMMFGTFPDNPAWMQVGYSRAYVEAGATWVSIKPAAMGIEAYSSGRIVRVPYSRNPDRMDSDTDSWPIPLEWATAEVGLEFLSMLFGPGGGQEDVSDIGRAYGQWKDVAMGYRSQYGATPMGVEVPLR